MLKKFHSLFALLSMLLCAPQTMAHPGQHDYGFIQTLLHQLSSADHLLIGLAFCLLIGLFLVSVRR